MSTVSGSASPLLGPSSGSAPTPANRHAPTAVELQRMQLAKLLKDPAKLAHVPAAPKEKTIRPPREMMKNVQGSSAGAGSGEFHVYKASRRREYERLKMMDERTQKELAEREFELKKRQWEEDSEAKTAKNRSKRQKRKEKAKGKGGVSGTGAPDGKADTGGGAADAHTSGGAPLKKRRLVNGEVMVFKRPGDEGEESEDDDEQGPTLADTTQSTLEPDPLVVEVQPREVVELAKIVIHEED